MFINENFEKIIIYKFPFFLKKWKNSYTSYNSLYYNLNIISLLEKANKYIIILNKSITEGISKLKELYSPYFPELPTIVTNSYEYVQSIKVIKENKSLLKSDTKSGIKQLKQNLSFLPNNVLMALTFMLSSSNEIKSTSTNETLKNTYDNW